jgi:Flp pilus assembly protein TadB
MNEKLAFLDEFGKAFVPKSFRPGLGSYLEKAGVDSVPYTFFGGLFILTAIITYFIYLFGVYPLIQNFNYILLFLWTFASWFLIQISIAAFIMVAIYFFLNLRIYKRTKDMEDLLADYLALVSTNLKGGMSFEKSLWAAIKSDFGILAKEIGIVSKKVATGNEVVDALDEFGKKYNSPILRRSIDLIKSEIVSGGRVAEVIDQLVVSLRKTRELKQEMVATALSYMIFMSVIVIIVTPALFALSRQLLLILLSLGNKIAGNVTGGTAFFSFAPPNIDEASFNLFAIGAVSVISIFTSIIISIIEKGDIKGGVKYIPMFLSASILLYLIFSVILEKLMSSLVVM